MSPDSLQSLRITLESLSGPVYILSHVSPDGDSVGSTVGLFHLLKARGIEAIPVLPQPVPLFYDFLLEGIPCSIPPLDFKNRTVVVLDCSDLKRLDQTGNLDQAKQVINIDHHLNNDEFGNINYVDVEAAAVGQIIHQMFTGHIPYPPEAAQALFTAIYTDTGRFSYSNTGANVMNAAAELIKLGANPELSFNCIYQARTLGYYKFLSEALSKIETYCDGRVAFLCLDRDLQTKYGVEDWEMDDINDYPRSLKGVIVSVIFKQTEDVVRVSLRSKGRVNVAEIARELGGGGHLNAAGASVKMSMDDSIEQLKKRLEQEF